MWGSAAYAVYGNQQVGVASSRAAAWGGTAASWVDLSPGGRYSVIRATSGTQQAGRVVNRAAIWAGTADSWVDLHPAGASISEATATTGIQQAGIVQWSNPWGFTSHAALWSGTADSWVDLHPSGGGDSAAYGMVPGTQVGRVGSVACLWHDTANSVVILNPPGAHSSAALAIADNQQAGYAHFGTQRDEHAVIWAGTADSFVDLHPPDAYRSRATATTGSLQAGDAGFGGWSRAVAWLGRADTWIDLHSELPDGYDGRSCAEGMWSDGTTTYIVGWAAGWFPGDDPEEGSVHAYLWKIVHSFGVPISEIPDQFTSENTPILGVPFTLSAQPSQYEDVTFSVASSNPRVLVPSGVIIKGTEGTYTLDLTPERDRFGETLINLIVSDGMHTTWRTFRLSVRKANHAPVARPDTIERRPGMSTKVAARYLLANDTDEDGDILEVTRIALSSENGAAVSLSEGWVFYLPPPGFLGTDQFTYHVSDGFGGTAIGTVTVLVVNEPRGPAQNQVALAALRDPLTGQVTSITLTYAGIPGRLYALERSPALGEAAHWVCLQALLASPAGLIEFTDPHPLPGEAYYRTAERSAPCP